MTLPTNEQRNLALTETYYKAMGKKDLVSVGKYLHPDVECFGPAAHVKGKNNVLESIKGFLTVFKSLTVQEKFASKDQVMLAYDLDFPKSKGIFRIAVLMKFKDELIARVELFYDARSFDEKKE